MQVSDLIQNDWGVDNTGPVYLVKLLDCVLFVKIKAEDSIQLLTVLAQPSNQQDLGGRYLHRGKATNWLRDQQVHLENLLFR